MILALTFLSEHQKGTILSYQKTVIAIVVIIKNRQGEGLGVFGKFDVEGFDDFSVAIQYHQSVGSSKSQLPTVVLIKIDLMDAPNDFS